MGVQILNDKTEFLNIRDLPKTLLVLGNGFDLTCRVPSDYKKFFEYILEKKLNYYYEELQRDVYINIFELFSLSSIFILIPYFLFFFSLMSVH